MKERPILFSAPMVRALLNGSKTQTRRVVKPQPTHFMPPHGAPMRARHTGPSYAITYQYGQPGEMEWRIGPIPAPGWYYVRGLLNSSIGGGDRPVWVWPEHFCFGFSENDDPESIELDTDITPENVQWRKAGDRLWVREAWWGPGGYDHFPPSQIPQTSKIEYVADGVGAIDVDGKLRSSIHMPRWASRITLEITGVRVERLQDISEADCWAEGIHEVRSAGDEHGDLRGSVRQDYQALWESINGPGSWDANPWVLAIEFKQVEGGAA